MQVLYVIPIARTMSRETLTYWSPEPVSAGSIVYVPLRNREIPGMVVKSEPISDVRAEVRTSDFRIKKIGSRKPIPLFSPALIKAAEATAIFMGTTTGAVLGGLLPAPLLEAAHRLKVPSKRWESAPAAALPEELIFQSEDVDRLIRYKSLIRETFAREESVYLCVPTLADAQQLTEKLGRGIEEYTVTLHSGLTAKELREAAAKVLRTEHPLLIVGTGAYIALERPDIKTIIIDRENSRAYKLPTRPYLDLRNFIEAYAKTRRVKLILGGLPLRIETLWRYEEHELSELVQPAFRLLTAAPHAIIDMREETGKAAGSKFQLFSTELKRMFQYALETGERCLVFVARRGLATLVMCQDCGSIVRDENGISPMVLHKGQRGNVLVSHVTGEVRSAHERCKVCESWRLEALGIGVERVAEEIAVLFPALKQFRVDQETAGTHKQIAAAVKKFYASPGGALIATERALAYLDEPIEHCGVVSIDSLLSLPEWKVSERIFSLLLKIRAISQKSYVVQTRKGDQSLIEDAVRGNIGDFYRNEIALRRALGYPPFTVLIKLSIVGTLARATAEMQKLLAYLEPFGIEAYPEPLHIGRNRFACHALIRVGRDSWPDQTLLEKLAALPPYVAVDVNPENLM